jgi:hypothetical protein
MNAMANIWLDASYWTGGVVRHAGALVQALPGTSGQ